MSAIHKPLKSFSIPLGRHVLKTGATHDDSWGIEIEMEMPEKPPKGLARNGDFLRYLTHNLTSEDFLKYWSITSDGSLRNGAELVSRGAVRYENLEEAFKAMRSTFDEFGIVPSFGYRTSVHVHMNAAHLTPIHFANILVLHTLLERSLIKMAGEEREGNLHCLMLTEAPAVVSRLQSLFKAREAEQFSMRFNELFRIGRYSALNFHSLFTLGTLEFRLHNGTYDTARLMSWVNTLRNIRDMATKCNDPRELIQLAKKSPDELLALIDCKDARTDIALKQIRTAQEIAFARMSWEAGEVKKEPTSRKRVNVTAAAPGPVPDMEGWLRRLGAAEEALGVRPRNTIR